MLLLDLPNENLHLILGHVERADIVNVALCSRLLRSLSERRILQLRYGELVTGGLSEEEARSSPSVRRSPLGTLYEIILNPAIGPHVSSLEYIHSGCEYWRKETLPSPAIPGTVLQAISKCKYLDDDELKSYSGAILGVERQDIAFAFLLTLLPNLKELILHGIPGPRTTMMVAKIVRRTHDSKGPHALGRLKSLTLWTTRERGYHKLQLVTSFPQLPSLRAMSGHLLQGQLWSSYPHTSGVECIRLYECRSQPHQFSQFLAGFPNLREFGLSISLNREWDANPYREALLEHAGDTLERLYMYGSLSRLTPTFHGSLRRWTPKYIGSLRGFKALKHIVLRYPQIVDGRTTQRLVDFLPASTESLGLLDVNHCFRCEDGGRQPEFVRLFADLPELKAEHLPNFGRIECLQAIEQSILTTCQAAGIQICLMRGIGRR